MKRFIFNFLLLHCIALNTQGQQGATPTHEQLLSIEQKLMDAVATGDTVVWKKYLHNDCLIATEDGESKTKKELISSMRPLPPGYVGKIVIIEPELRRHGNTVVLNFILDEYLELFTQKIHTQYKQMSTWVNSNGDWKLIAMQVFEIPKNPKPVDVAGAVLTTYAGTYALSDERKCTVYVEGGKLMVKKGTRDPEELLAETENVFFRKDNGRVRIIFIKWPDANGYRMIERRAGEDLVWK